MESSKEDVQLIWESILLSQLLEVIKIQLQKVEQERVTLRGILIYSTKALLHRVSEDKVKIDAEIQKRKIRVWEGGGENRLYNTNIAAVASAIHWSLIKQCSRVRSVLD